MVLRDLDLLEDEREVARSDGETLSSGRNRTLADAGATAQRSKNRDAKRRDCNRCLFPWTRNS